MAALDKKSLQRVKASEAAVAQEQFQKKVNERFQELIGEEQKRLHKEAQIESARSKVWLDDVRAAPENYLWVKSLEEFFEKFKSGGLDKISEISFDHDLGDDDTSIEVLNWIEEMASKGGRIPTMHVHSANPVGIRTLSNGIKAIHRNFGEQADKEGRYILGFLRVCDESLDEGFFNLFRIH